MRYKKIQKFVSVLFTSMFIINPLMSSGVFAVVDELSLVGSPPSVVITNPMGGLMNSSNVRIRGNFTDVDGDLKEVKLEIKDPIGNVYYQEIIHCR
jgi:hypothetical protein